MEPTLQTLDWQGHIIMTPLLMEMQKQKAWQNRDFNELDISEDNTNRTCSNNASPVRIRTGFL